MMKILAVQGSPRSKASTTEILLQEFLKGARTQGAETETVYLKEKAIHLAWDVSPAGQKLREYAYSRMICRNH